LIIRKMHEKDYEAYKLLFDEAYGEYLESLRHGNPEQYRKERCEMRAVSNERFDFYLKTGSSFVAQEKGEVIGYVASQTISYMRGLDKVLWIEYVVVKSEFKRHGIGAALLRRLAHNAKASKIDQIFSTINPDNEASIKLHQKVGFKITNRKVASFNI